MKVVNIANLQLWGRAIACCLFTVCVGFSMPSVAAEHPMQTDEAAQWGDAAPMLPAGAKIAVLSGDPGGDDLYTVGLKFPAHYAIPAHFHPKDGHLTVLRGTLFMGMGDKLDTRSGKALPMGSFAITPTGVNHYVYTKDEVIILLHGMGPVDFIYVDPADDPRNKE